MNAAISKHLETLGLERIPFPPTPDAAVWFQTCHLEAELAEAAHCLNMRAGIVLLTGEIGTGKSTFLRRLLALLENEGVTTSLVFNTFLQGGDLLAAILSDFGITPTSSPASDVDSLNRFLIERWKDGTTCVLMIDDAQNLSLESLELLRLLTNLETGQEKLLQIVISGQPELRDNLDAPAIRQLTSRICKHVRLEALSATEVRHYVEFRLAAAGNEAQAIRLHHDAPLALHKASQGNPRRIHFIMDRCLYGLYALPPGKRVIDAALVRAATVETGALPVRTRKGLPLALVASVLGVSVCASIALMLRDDGATANASTPATFSTTATLDVAAEKHWNDCLANLGGTRTTHTVPAALVQELKAYSGLCLRDWQGRWQAAWKPALTQDDLTGTARVNPVTARLQQLLQVQGHYDGRLDGQPGPLTRRALARFQQQHLLPATGSGDPLTLLLLDIALANTQPDASQMEPTPHGNG